MDADGEGKSEAAAVGPTAPMAAPEAGQAADAAEGRCRNCGAALVGEYCHQCGQKGRVHRTIGAFWHDLLHGALHFEGKFWRTLPLLAWRPGELTRRYVAGERTRFVSPVAIFLFSVFMMFAVFSLVGGPFGSSQEARSGIREAAERDLQQEQAQRQERMAELRAERQRLARAGEPTAAVDGAISALERETAAGRARTTRVFTADELMKAPAPAGGEGEAAGEVETAFTDEMTGIGWIDASIRKARENPALVAYKLQANAYKFSWALIPISVPFVWLLFLHRRRYRRYGPFDHTVFVTYSIAFMSLGLISLSLLRPLGLGDDFVELAIAIVPPLHMYRQLRGAYALSRWSAVWRTLMLILFAFIAGTLFVSLLLTLGGVG